MSHLNSPAVAGACSEPAPGTPAATTPVLIHDWQKTARQAQEGLRLSQERLEVALRAADMASREWQIGTGTLSWSGSAGRLYGLDATANPPGNHRDWLGMIHPEDREQAAKDIRQATTHGGTFETEFRVLGADGNCRWIREKGEVFLSDDGRPGRLSAVDIDVTARRTVEEALRTAKLEAEAASLAKTQFLANMSHEIRTPIGAILGFAELLGEVHEAPENRDEYMRRIRRNGELLLRLIDDILDLSKVESGLVEVERLEVSLPEMIEDVRETLFARARNKGVGLTFAADGQVPAKLVTDPLRLRQILINLIGNAVKFTERGGVSVTLRYDAPTAPSTGMLTFEIRDTGAGIPKESVARLFQPFLQADSSTTRRFGGTGLGLALSLRLARLLGGDVRLTETGPLGSVFVVSIACETASDTPMLDPSQIGDDPTMAMDHAAARRPLDDVTVLVVDDSLDNRLLMGRILQLAGAAVEYASDGREGVVKGRDDAYDAVLMDMQMPEMDGYQATRQLRHDGIAKPIIAITAHGVGEERERCLAAGCSGYLTKPVNRAELITMLTQLLFGPNGTPVGGQSSLPQRLAAKAAEASPTVH